MSQENYVKWSFSDNFEKERLIPVGVNFCEIGRLEIECYYTCDKRLFKCKQNFVISLEVSSKVGAVLHELEKAESEGKLEIKEKDDKKVKINVKRGKGEGRIILTYKFKYRPPKEEMDDSIDIYVYKSDEKETVKEKLYETAAKIRTLIPFNIEYEIEPSADEYFVGDEVKLKFNINPKHTGLLELYISGATEVKKRVLNIEAKKTLSTEIKTQLKSTDGYIKVEARTPDLDYRKTIEIPILIKEPPRVAVESIVVGKDVIPGSQPVIAVTLINRSPSTTVTAGIEIEAYGVKTGSSETLNPLDKKTLRLQLPPVPFREEYGNVGMIKITEPQDYTLEETFPLPEVKKFPLKVIFPEGVLIYTPKPILRELIIENLSQMDVNINISKNKSDICNLEFDKQSLILQSNSKQKITVRIHPLKVGKETISFILEGWSDNIIVERREVPLRVEVLPGFSINNVEIIQPTDIDEVVAGQTITIRLEVNSHLKEHARLLAKGLTVDLNQEMIVSPGTSKHTVGEIRTLKEGKVIIAVTDGVYSKELTLPIKVVKPYVNFISELTEIPGGLTSSVGFVVENPFDVQLDVEYLVIADKDIILLGEKLKPTEVLANKIRLPPKFREEVFLNVVAKVPGERNLIIELEPFHGSVKGDKLRRVITLNIKSPMEILPSPKTLDVILPYPITSNVFGKNYLIKKVNFGLINKTGSAVENVEISLGVNNGEIILNPDKITIPVLSSRQQLTFDVEVSIPFNVPFERAALNIAISIGKIYQEKRDDIVEIDIRRRNSFSVFYPHEKYVEGCPFPSVKTDDCFEVLVPIEGEDVLKICGEAMPIFITLHKLLMRSAKLLSHIEPKDIWSAAAKYIYEVLSPEGDSENASKDLFECIDSYPHSVRGILIIPAIIWKITICRLASYTKLLKELIKEISQVKPGIISLSSNQPLYILRGRHYETLVKAVVSADEKSLQELRSYINQKSWEAGDLAAIYAITTGNGAEFSEDVADYLQNTNIAGYSLYVTACGWRSILKKENLRTLDEIIREQKSSRVSLALSLLYMLAVSKRYTLQPKYDIPLSYLIKGGEASW